MVFGFFTPDIRATSKVIQDAGGVLIGGLNVVPHIGVDGGDYAYRFYRAQYGRVYALAQNKGFTKWYVRLTCRHLFCSVHLAVLAWKSMSPGWW